MRKFNHLLYFSFHCISLVLVMVLFSGAAFAQSGSIWGVIGLQSAAPANEKSALTVESGAYTVTVSFGADAGVPADAHLVAEEIRSDTAAYADYASELESRIEGLQCLKLFDISLVDSSREKVHPAAPVEVRITCDDPMLVSDSRQIRVMHFAPEYLEFLEPKEVQSQPVAPDTEAPASRKLQNKGLRSLFRAENAVPEAATVAYSELVFETESFSVFAVVATGDEDPSHTTSRSFEFYVPQLTTTTDPETQEPKTRWDGSAYERYSYINENGIRITHQDVPDGGFLNNPGVPVLEGFAYSFTGWYRDPKDPSTLFDFSKSISANGYDVQTPPKENKTVKLYAGFFEKYYVYFFSDHPTKPEEKNPDVYFIETIIAGDAFDVNTIVYTPDNANAAFRGWSFTPGAQSDANVISSESKITTGSFETGSHELHLYPVVLDVYWVSFDSNDWTYKPADDQKDNDFAPDPVHEGHYSYVGKGNGTVTRFTGGASFSNPAYVLQGKTIASAHIVPPVPTRRGYDFDGWYQIADNVNPNLLNTLSETDLAAQGITKFDFNQDSKLAGNITLYARWIPKEVDYTIVYYLENPDDDNYSYFTQETQRGYSDSPTASRPYVDIFSADASRFPDYEFFTLDHMDQDQIIKGDGSTVVRAYFRRNVYTLRFYYAGRYSDNNNTNVPFVATETSLYSNNYPEQKQDSYQLAAEDALIANHRLNATDNGQQGRYRVVDLLPQPGGSYTIRSDTLTRDDRTYEFYYFDIQVKYGANVANIWPSAPFAEKATGYGVTLQAGNGSEYDGNPKTYSFISWATRLGSGYYNANDNKNIKGPYSRLDRNVILDKDPSEGHIAQSFLAYWNDPTIYYYRIYYSLLKDEEYDPDSMLTDQWSDNEQFPKYIMVDGVPYRYQTTYPVGSTATVGQQTSLTFEGVMNCGQNIQVSDVTWVQPGIRQSCPINYIYKRNPHTVTFMHGGEQVEKQNYVYGDNLSELLTTPEDQLDIPVYKYFTGWYEKLDDKGEVYGDPYVFPEVLGDVNLIVFAGTANKTYRVWIQPNGGQLSEDQATYFNASYGELIREYALTRNYVPTANPGAGKYYYVIYDRKDPRQAFYTDNDGVASAARAAGADVSGKEYIYRPNGWTFAGWYRVTGEKINTYYEVQEDPSLGPPSIDADDSLELWDFAKGVTEDMALRAVWKRNGYFTVVYDASMYEINQDGTIDTVPGDATQSIRLDPSCIKQDGDITLKGYTSKTQEDYYYTDLSRASVLPAPDMSGTMEGYPKLDDTYVFEGWRTPDGNIHSPGDIFAIHEEYAIEDTAETNNRHFYYFVTAVYTKIGTTSITYDANSGSGTLTDCDASMQSDNTALSFNPADNTVSGIIIGNDVKLSTGRGFSRSGYILIGWNDSKDDADAGIVKYTLGGTYAADGDTNTLYAVWLTGVPLPATGGIGTLPFALGGSALMLLSAWFIYFRSRRRREY